MLPTTTLPTGRPPATPPPTNPPPPTTPPPTHTPPPPPTPLAAALLALACALAPTPPPALAAQPLGPPQAVERLRTHIDAAELSGDLDALAQAVALGRSAVAAFPDDALVNHYMGYALYRLAAPTMEADRDEAVALLEEAESFLKRSIEIEPIAESHALVASTMGMRIGGPLSAVSLGMRSGSAMGRAKELGPQNPRVRLLEGISAFHSPQLFGGGPDGALDHILAAIDLFERDPAQPPLPAWGHAEAYAWLGQTYAALGRTTAARAAYEKALELEPGYEWVRATLLPALPATATPPTAARRPTTPAQPPILTPDFLDGYSWRNLGPDRGGRSIAVSGVVGRPNEAYFGATGGGLWKTTNGGDDWHPVTDFQISSASVGAVAVAETDPDLVFIGTGETCIRGNILPGDGVYRSRDAGATWEHVGFSDSDGISKIRIHPANPDLVYVASFGKYGVPSEERGVFRSTDGGDSWERILFRDERTGAIDIAIDRNNPDVIYASLWEAFRKEYTMSSGGPGSGMFKSTDGGDTWTEITRNPGMPAEGVVGRIGVAVSSANSNRVYSLFEHEDGGLFRSDDAGATWELVNDERRIRQRAFYYTHVFADHHDEDVVYVQNTSFFRSTDGGATYEVINNGTHGDFHDFWIDPDDPAHVVVANDGGGAVSFTTGSAWTDQEFSTAQFYHGVTTAHIPWHICGSQQDNSTLCLPSDWNAQRFEQAVADTADDSGARAPAITEGSMDVHYRAGGGEPGYIAPDPKDLDVFFSGTNNGRYIDKFNRRLGTSREVNPYPWFYSGEPAIDMVERWQWTFPIIFSPVDPNILYASSNRLWRTTDGGTNWEALSGDLTRAEPMTLGHSGGPITGDMNGPEVYATIFSVGPGKRDTDIIWTGSDDGLVHVTTDGGASWTNVTPPDMPDFGRVSLIDASSFDDARAYVSARLPLLNDFRPHIWRTNDFGQSWTRITNGIRDDAYVNSIREDPVREGLLYAGTNHGVYISYDDGELWQELNPDLPDIPITDVIPEHDELAMASHGRGFWALDNIAPLRQLQPGTTERDLALFEPAAAYRSANGVVLSWWLREEDERAADAKLEVLDADGEVVRTFTPAQDGVERDRWAGPALPMAAGLNRLRWDLRTDPAATFPGMILWGVRTMAPAVPPGTYGVRLTVGDMVETTEVEVRRNPWIADVSDDDLIAQYDFGVQVRDQVDAANSAVIAIRDVKAQLDDRLAASDDARLAEAGERLRAAASAVEAEIYQVRNRSNQDPLNFPIKVNNRLANLLSMSERGDGRPGSGMYAVFEIMVDRLGDRLAEMAAVWEGELVEVNEVLRALDMDEIVPDVVEPVIRSAAAPSASQPPS